MESLGGRTCLGIEKKSRNLSFGIKLRYLIGILVNKAIIYKMCGVQVRGQGYRYMIRKQQMIEAI